MQKKHLLYVASPCPGIPGGFVDFWKYIMSKKVNMNITISSAALEHDITGIYMPFLVHVVEEVNAIIAKDYRVALTSYSTVPIQNGASKLAFITV